MAKQPTDKKTPSFEESLTRLELIVKEMESGTLSLDEMIARFEEGSALVKQCGHTLNEVEKKIELLIRKQDTLTTAPFEPEKSE